MLRLLLLLAAGIVLVFFAAFRDPLPESGKIVLQSVSPKTAGAGRALRLSLTGSGFDRRTRLALIPDTGNRRALLRSLPTWSYAQSATSDGDLLYLANNYRGVQVFDISQPKNPRQIGTLALPGKAWKVTLAGRLALIAAREGGMHVVDAGDPRHLRLLGSVELGGNALDVVAEGGLAYVANSLLGLQVVDFADPGRPRLLTTLSLPGNPSALAVEDRVAYLAAAREGLQVVDLHDPRQPRLIGALAMPETVFDLEVRKGTAFLAAGPGGLLTVDLGDPRAPARIAAVDTLGTARAVALDGDRAFVADLANGLLVIDIADPSRPRLVGRYDIPGLANSVVLAGARAAVTSSRTLHLIDIRRPASPPPAASAPDVPEFAAAGPCTFSPWRAGKIPPTDRFIYLIQKGNAAETGGKGKSLIRIIDIADPQHPLAVSSFQAMPGLRHLARAGQRLWSVGAEGVCRFDLADPIHPQPAGCLRLSAPGKSIAVDGERVFVGDSGGNLSVVDASSPVSPRLLGSAALPWHLKAFSAAEEIALSGRLALVADGRNGLLIFDVEADSPRLVGSLQLPGTRYAHGLRVRGHTAYVDDFRYGLVMVDFSDPQAPQLIADLDLASLCQRFFLQEDRIVYFNVEGDRASLPLPAELTDLIVQSDSRLRVTLPPAQPGTYTLRAFNGSSSAELPGAIEIR